jgi:hypothetical protein
MTSTPTTSATPDPALAKVIEKCQKVLLKGARGFVTKKLKLLATCADGIQKCIQTVADVAKRGACVTAAGAKCTAAIDKIVGEETKLRNTVLDKCGTVPAAFVTGPEGLGFGALSATCGNLDSSAAVADCIVERSACEADRAFAAAEPRAGELIGFAGVPPDRRAMLACLPNHGGAGEDVDLESGAGKGIAKCGSGIAKANATLVGGEYAALATCAGRLFTCAQTKRGDDACPTKAAAGCVKDLAKIGAGELKVGPAIAKKCTSPLFDYDLLRRPAAVNLDVLTSACALANAPAPTSLDAYGSCLLRLQACRTTSLLRLAMPRAVPLLGTLSPPFTFPTDCPP